MNVEKKIDKWYERLGVFVVVVAVLIYFLYEDHTTKNADRELLKKEESNITKLIKSDIKQDLLLKNLSEKEDEQSYEIKRIEKDLKLIDYKK